jgi:CheY-like chemotaxis protein
VPLRVVYLDDEADLVETFIDLFSSEEIQITGFSEVPKALEYLKANKPDVIFLDYRLPGQTGDELANKMDPSVPKALISGELSLKPKSKFEKQFKKPFVPKDVFEFFQEIKARIKAA